MLPDVTIVVPTYLQEKTLDVCLDSLLNQDYEGVLQIIVVDNSPSFGLASKKESYPKIQFLWEPNPGSYNARNKALETIETDIVAFTDSDCIAKEDWISTAVEIFQKDPDLDFIVGEITVFPHNADSPKTAEIYEMLFAFPQKDFLEKDSFGATANIVVKRDAMKKVGFFNGALKSKGDMEWGQRAIRMGAKARYESRVIVYHPARIDKDIRLKMKRVVAGARDQENNWRSCLVYMYKFLRPPRRKIICIWKSNYPKVSFLKKIKVTFYTIFLTWYEAYYRLYFQITKMPSPR